ncbi:DUF6285 domain-containing protein [Stutzerimonas stutzeri]|uniref:DUF6285 domain-containing protein n=1 Tax=Stutzerimonas stutzeri TaxID=316 RepID=UPI00210C07D4|nr:DUF6285 domain-containing protein [Stutzerimonas stutzeri]MCQ4320122.1 DUF6285 domain-containing protein [Stutzerimonas stutzeri]
MQNLPDNQALLESVEAFLKDEVMPQLPPAGAFRARVSANVLGMVRRHLEASARDGAQEERELLHQLTGKKGTLAGLTTELCRLISTGALTPDDPRLRDYLWLTTLAKMAVDQPTYSGYVRAREEWAAFSDRSRSGHAR